MSIKDNCKLKYYLVKQNISSICVSKSILLNKIGRLFGLFLYQLYINSNQVVITTLFTMAFIMVLECSSHKAKKAIYTLFLTIFWQCIAVILLQNLVSPLISRRLYSVLTKHYQLIQCFNYFMNKIELVTLTNKYDKCTSSTPTSMLHGSEGRGQVLGHDQADGGRCH